jgi:hypothetical protein
MRDAGSTWAEIAKVRYKTIRRLGSHMSFETEHGLVDFSKQNRRIRQEALVQGKVHFQSCQGFPDLQATGYALCRIRGR